MHRRALHKLPQPLRFQISGFTNTTGFMSLLALGNYILKDSYPASKIYSMCSLAYMPIGHAVTSLVVFGWPKEYFKNLLMNFPIGVIGTTIGSYSTGFLVAMEFDAKVRNFLQSMNLVGDTDDGDEGNGQAYTNIAVLIITGIWGYVVSTMVNSQKPTKKHEKEL